MLHYFGVFVEHIAKVHTISETTKEIIKNLPGEYIYNFF